MYQSKYNIELNGNRSATQGVTTVVTWLHRTFLVPLALLLADYGAIFAAVKTAYMIRVHVLPGFVSLVPFNDIPMVYKLLVIPLAFVALLHFDRMYTQRLPFWQQVERIFKVSVYAMVIVLVIMYFTGAVKQVARIYMLFLWLSSIVYLIAGRYIMQKMLHFFGAWQRPVILIGAGKTASLLNKAFAQDAGLGYTIIGAIEDRPAPEFIECPIIGTFSQAEQVIRQQGVNDVIVAAPGLGREELLHMVYRLQPHVDHVTIVPDLFGIPVGCMELETLFREKTVLLKVRNNLADLSNRFIKRIFDCVASVVGGIVITPLLLVIVILIYLDSPGAVMFAHQRIGRNGNKFPCYKFRTMVPNAKQVLENYLAHNPEARAEWERDFKLKDDPRITRIGKFLRKTSLDELPQLLNVIKGEMSLVGPRPIVDAEIARYDDYIYDYYLVRPGITGLWQVSGRNDIGYDERVQMDSWYVRNWSLWLDISLLIKTVKVVFRKEGAY